MFSRREIIQEAKRKDELAPFTERTRFCASGKTENCRFGVEFSYARLYRHANVKVIQLQCKRDMFALVICNGALLRGLRARHFSGSGYFSFLSSPLLLLLPFLFFYLCATTHAILLDLVKMKYISPYIFGFLPSASFTSIILRVIYFSS